MSTRVPQPMHRRYGLFFRDISDQWPGVPLTPERSIGIRWGYTWEEARKHLRESPDVLLFIKNPSGRIRRSYRDPR